MKLAERGDGEHVTFDVYRVPYPVHHVVKKLPLGITKPPKFDKFNGRGSPKEHIAYYINVMGDLTADESYLLKFFGSSLTGLAFEWYSSQQAGSISDWTDMQKMFREIFYIAERQWWINLIMRCKRPPHQEDVVQIFKQNLKRELLERMIGMEIWSFDRLNNVVAEIEAFLERYSTNSFTSQKSKPDDKKPAGKEVHVVDLKTFEKQRDGSKAVARSSNNRTKPQGKLPEEISEANTEKTYESHILTPIKEQEDWQRVPNKTKKRSDEKPTPRVHIWGVTPKPPIQIVTPIWHSTEPRVVMQRNPGNKRQQMPLPLYRGGSPSLMLLQALIHELDEYEQLERHPIQLQKYVPWEELENLTLEAPTGQETPQPQENLFWGPEPTKRKRKKRKSKKKKVVVSRSCNTISSLLGLVKHHDEEEIYSPSNDVNQVRSSGPEFITRSGRKWGRPSPANQNIIFRGEPFYQIPEPEGQTFLAKVVSTHLLLVSTQCFKAKAECCRNGEVVSTLDQVSVDTRDPSQRRSFASLGQCVDTPHGQVDTLRKLCDLKSLLNTWHSRDLVDRPWIMFPRPPRVLLDFLGINTLLIGHPTTREPPRAFQKSFWRQRELSSLFLLPLCFFNPIPTSPSTRSED
ncbi:hypothetical protein Taro_048736 [Colocasia esculenta]|uniref:Retrotransposon gag domain-containing protein n=1 Tax=Colocasia esculenta TaxID=4460 RepID=A0A843X8Z3_COLES|nr:hypothetical protein [Colocasia esculenta]